MRWANIETAINVIMSGKDDTTEEGAAAALPCCASCGKAEVDDVKLKQCDDCDLVRYCSDECQQDHWPEHKANCKERAAELQDELLFKQPESTHMGDCPICCLPIPTDTRKTSLYPCCIEIICMGCTHSCFSRQKREDMKPTCPFCRHPLSETEEEVDKNLMKRVAANDPVALCVLGKRVGYNGDHDGAIKYFTKSAELGDADANYQLSLLYSEGQHVEKDEKKKIFHLEEAAIAGHPMARHNLGCSEERNGKIDRAVKHWIIAANLGCDDSVQALKGCYKEGVVSKEDFAAALRAHYAAVDETKSPDREAAARADEAGMVKWT